MSVSIFDVMSQLSKAQALGQQIQNPSTWANKASLAAVIAGFITMAISALSLMGVDIPVSISQTDIMGGSTFFASVLIFVSNYLHKASNVDAGKK